MINSTVEAPVDTPGEGTAASKGAVELCVVRMVVEDLSGCKFPGNVLCRVMGEACGAGLRT